MRKIKRERERERERKRQKDNWRGVDIVATNVTAATGPKPGVTSSRPAFAGKREKDRERQRETETERERE